MCTMQLDSVLIVCFQGDLCMIVGPVGSGKVRNKNLFGLHVSPKTTYLLFQYYCCQIFILAAIMSWAVPFVASTSGGTYNSGLQATLVD